MGACLPPAFRRAEQFRRGPRRLEGTDRVSWPIRLGTAVRDAWRRPRSPTSGAEPTTAISVGLPATVRRAAEAKEGRGQGQAIQEGEEFEGSQGVEGDFEGSQGAEGDFEGSQGVEG